MTERELFNLTEVNRFLTQMNLILGSDYRIGGRPASCLDIAIEVAKLVSVAGFRPSLLMVTDVDRGLVLPRVYGGQVKWISHSVCGVKDVVFDPIAKVPVCIDKYLSETFMKRAVSSIEIPTGGMRYLLGV